MAVGNGRCGVLTLAGCVLAALVAAAPVAAQSPIGVPKLGNPVCLNPAEPTPEIYGPTDVGATTGNQRLSVGINPQGTVSVLRWPSPSYYDHVRYLTLDRDLPRLGLEPNEGAFSGLRLTLADGREETVWLRDLDVRQRYASEDSDTIATRLRSRRHRFVVEIDDVVPPDGDVLLRRHVLRPERGSPVRVARLLAFANLQPVASRHPLVPTQDWCDEVRGADRARYDPAHDAIVWSVSEVDQAVGEPRSAALAMGLSRASDGHHVGADRYTGHPSARDGPPSAYDDAADGALSGGDELGPAEVDSALSAPLGRAPVNVVFAAAATPEAAGRLLERWRRREARRAAAAKRADHLRWLRRAPLPRRAPPTVRRLAKRALISLRQAIDERAGRRGDLVAIVASLATQSPYAQDWIRDGAFFNEALDEIGQPQLVARHNLFYAEVQHKLEEGAPPGSPASACGEPTPDGNWFMTNWADGPDAGLFTWEIDETALGLWTLWRHFERTRDRAYLERVYPALRRSAEFLVAFRDPATGLPPGTACEDDNPPAPGQPTFHSSGPALLAMRAAGAAARALGRGGEAARWEARAAELDRAVDERHRAEGGAWTADYGDGGWALWPVRPRPYDHPRSRAQAELAWRAVSPSFAAPRGPRRRGQYEAKALHGLAHYHRAVDPAGMARVKRGLKWIAGAQANYQGGTGILGEAWYVRDGRIFSVVSQPHVWAQVLFYLAAVEAYGRAPYRTGRPERLAE